MAFQNFNYNRRRGVPSQAGAQPQVWGALHHSLSSQLSCLTLAQVGPASPSPHAPLSQRALHNYSHQRQLQARNENYPQHGLTRAQIYYQQSTYGFAQTSTAQSQSGRSASALQRRRPRLTFSRWHMMISSRYKTELCRQFAEDSDCPFDDKCLFAHGSLELRPLPRHPKYKTELCRDFHQDGFCSFGPRCNFVHSTTDVASLSAQLRNRSSTPDSGNESCDDLSTDSLAVCPTPSPVLPDIADDDCFQFPLDWYRDLTDDTSLDDSRPSTGMSADNSIVH